MLPGGGPGGVIAGRYDVEQDRDQRNTIGLRDVAYRISSEVDLLPHAWGR